MKIIINSVLLVTFLMFASTASALTISEVGGLDEYVYSSYVSPSSLENEIQFVADAGLALDTTGYAQTDVTSANWVNVTENDGFTLTNYYAFDLGLYQSDYFVLKLGANIAGTPDNTYLYLNHFSQQYAVVDIVDFPAFDDDGEPVFVALSDVGKISHVGAPVPEPSTLLLLGAGITGLALYRRKKK